MTIFLRQLALVVVLAAACGLGAVNAGAAEEPAGKPASRGLALSQFTVAGCSLPNFSLEDALRKLHELSFAGVEIAVFIENKSKGGDTYPCAVVSELGEEEKRRLKALAQRFQHVSTHLPYGPEMRPIAADPAIRARSRRELHRAIEDSGFWGSRLANIHVLSEPGVGFAEAKVELVELYRELGDHAGRLGIRLAIEITPPYRMAEYLELVRAIDRENVGGSIDTGHMNFYRADLAVEGAARQTPEGVRRYNDMIVEFMTALGPKLYHLHVDDVRAADWREHFVPGAGILDWPRLLGQLARMDYRGLLAAEILYYEGATDTGLLQTRVFSMKTQDGAPAAGLRQMRKFFAKLLPPEPRPSLP